MLRPVLPRVDNSVTLEQSQGHSQTFIIIVECDLHRDQIFFLLYAKHVNII